MGTRREAVIGEEANGLRLDAALVHVFSEHSRSAFARLIDAGAVAIDGRTVSKPSVRVETGQSVTVAFPEPAPAGAVAQNLPLSILFEDSDILVVDKPAGLVVHPAAGHTDRTLVNALLFHASGLSGIGGEIRPGIVHRLDKDTSGLMVIAKNDESHRALASLWSSAEVRKEYLALVYGTPSPLSGTVDQPIGRDPGNRKRMAIAPGGRRAVTEYAVERRFRHVALVRCRLHTGRTHQIRVHMKSIGHPIVGDPVYSGPQWRGIPDRRLQHLLAGFSRQALHAERLSFPHPRTGAPVSFHAPLPRDFAALLEALGEAGAGS